MSPSPEPTDFRHNGWPLVMALSFAQLVSWGTIYYGFALFVVPMEEALGWNRATLNGAMSLGSLVGGFCAYPVGRLIDRQGGRLLMSAGSLVASLMFVVWSQVEEVWVFYALWIGLGATKAMTLYDPVFAVVTRLFPDNFRRRITIITLLGGLASTAFVPLTAFFIHWLGWRDALLALAACNLLICLPVHALWLRDRAAPPAPVHTAPDLPQSRGPMQRALRHPAFWALLVSFTAFTTVAASLTFHYFPLVAERGVPQAVAVAIFAVIGPCQVLGRIVLLALPPMNVATIGRIVVLIFPLSVLMLLPVDGGAIMLFAFILLYGLANGCMTIVRGTAVPDLLWRQGYGAINGAIALPGSIAAAVGPTAAALLWEISGAYGPVLWVIFGLSLLVAGAFWFAVSRREQ
ncbi:MFS transporter [Ferrovibrio sp.]|uniref:MFS transporter n=1 Tax=Ferrovibrio sp. TaxID=1917215 RepID=UPI003D2DA829